MLLIFLVLKKGNQFYKLNMGSYIDLIISLENQPSKFSKKIIEITKNNAENFNS